MAVHIQRAENAIMIFHFVGIREFERNPKEFASILLVVLGGSSLLQKRPNKFKLLSQYPSLHYVNHWWFTVN